jgi:pentatricopeptide repeat protein
MQLFQSIVENSVREPDKPRAGGLYSSSELFEDIARLARMRTEGTPAAEQAALFLNKIYPKVRPPGSVPPAFKAVLDEFVVEISASIVSKVARGEDYNNLPSLSQLTHIQRDLRLLRAPQAWASCILQILDHVCLVEIGGSKSSPQPGRCISPKAWKALMKDIIRAWRLFIIDPCTDDELTKLGDSFGIPSSSAPKGGNHRGRMENLFPRYVPDALNHVMAAAVATCCLITDTARVSADVQSSAWEFTVVVKAALDVSPQDPFSSRYLQALTSFPRLQSYVQNRIEHFATLNPRSNIGSSKLYNRVVRCRNMRNLAEVDRCWSVFCGLIRPDGTKESSIRDKEGRFDTKGLFDLFIGTFATLRQTEKAKEAWKLMQSIGLQSSIETWTSYLNGCKLGYNAQGIREAWVGLKKSGLQLDEACWTARISGLCRTKNIDEAIKALVEMRDVWDEAQKHQQGQRSPLAVPLTAAPVNAIITELVKDHSQGTWDVVLSLLEWAERCDIQPDIVTFNAILASPVRLENDKEAKEILGLMAKYGVKPDDATHTILLERMVPLMGDASTEEQLKHITSVLAFMEECKVNKNPRVYGKLLHSLRQQGPRTVPAMQAVLDHYLLLGLKPSPHMNTILLDTYLAQEPPDTAAVKKLVDILSNTMEGQDRIFWERAIDAFLLAGELDTALNCYRRIEDSFTVTLSTLANLLDALLRSGQREEAARLTSRVYEQKKKWTAEERASDRFERFRSHRFWVIANRHGVLRVPGEESTAVP